MIDVPLAVAVPLAAWVETETLVAAPPVILRAMALLADPLPTVWLTVPATGGGTVMVTLTVAGADVPLGLVAVYWKLSGP